MNNTKEGILQEFDIEERRKAEAAKTAAHNVKLLQCQQLDEVRESILRDRWVTFRIQNLKYFMLINQEAM